MKGAATHPLKCPSVGTNLVTYLQTFFLFKNRSKIKQIFLLKKRLTNSQVPTDNTMRNTQLTIVKVPQVLNYCLWKTKIKDITTFFFWLVLRCQWILSHGFIDGAKL